MEIQPNTYAILIKVKVRRMVNTRKRLENYAQYVYSQLLQLNDFDNTLVSKRVTIRGQSGATNEFDIYS